MALPDGVPTTLARSEAKPDLLTVAGAKLFWIDVVSLSADGSRVYYSAGPSVRVVPSGGGSAIDVVSATNEVPAALALEGSSLVYATSDNANIELATVDPVDNAAMASCTTRS